MRIVRSRDTSWTKSVYIFGHFETFQVPPNIEKFAWVCVDFCNQKNPIYTHYGFLILAQNKK